MSVHNKVKVNVRTFLHTALLHLCISINSHTRNTMARDILRKLPVTHFLTNIKRNVIDV